MKRKQTVSRTLKSDLDHIRELISNLKETLHESGEDGKSYIKDLVQGKIDALENKMNAITTGIHDEAIEYIREYPIKSVLIAALTGFALAKLF